MRQQKNPDRSSARPRARQWPRVRLALLALVALPALAGAAGHGASAASEPAEPTAAADPTGLVAAYGFDEGAGGIVTDSSGTGNTGTISGAAWTASGRFGSALSFDGVDDWVTIPDDPTLDRGSALTIEAWIRPTTVGGWRTLAMKETPGSFTYALYSDTSAGRPRSYVGTTYLTGGAAIPTGSWTHLASSWDGTTLRLYVNGALSASRPLTVAPADSAGPLRIGGTSVWPEFFAGLIDEVRVYTRALSEAEIAADMAESITGGAPPVVDSTPPAVSITAPAAGTVSGTIDVTADAADDAGVAGVQFKLDGADLGAEDASAPYSATWATMTATNGTHTLTAVARDTSGNVSTSAGVEVTVSNAGPAELGQWGAPITFPHVALHAVLLPGTGRVLAFTDGDRAYVFDPATGGLKDVRLERTNLFCAAHVVLENGKILLVGGDAAPLDNGPGITDVNVFDPATETWSDAGSMVYPRWYPTATTLPNGDVLAVSGATNCYTCLEETPELYDASTDTWRAMPSARRFVPMYPFMFVLPDGRVLQAGSSEFATDTQVLDLATETWSMVDPRVIDSGSAVMYEPGKVMKSGSSSEEGGHNIGPSNADTWVMDATAPSPAWEQTQSMAFPRTFHNLVLLPDGTVLAVGGTTQKNRTNTANAVKAAELWSPVTRTWTTLASAQRPRLYHSTGLLLPDGRVFTSGSGRESGMTDERNAEIFSPPYLFKGTRPVITGAPRQVEYGASFSVTTPDAADVTSVSLIATGAVTHSLDENQRFLRLDFTRGNGRIDLEAPANDRLAPPGEYMLFLLDAQGVPSVASFVRVTHSAPPPDTSAPSVAISAPADGATVNGSTTIDANASDNVAVTGVQFKLDGANLGAEDTTAPYSLAWDTTTATNGTHTLTAVARDAAGNTTTSAPIGVEVANSAPPPPPPPSDLVLALGFEEATGILAADSSGSGNTGTLSGATWTASGKYGGGLSFDGVDDRVTVADAASLDLTGPMTLEAWLRPTGATGWRTALLKENGSSLAYGLYANSSSGKPRGYAGSAELSAATGLAAGAWTHVAFTFDGTTERMYLNGALSATRTVTATVPVSAGPLRIGWNAIWPEEAFAGLVDDVRIYSRALSQTEVSADMGRPVGGGTLPPPDTSAPSVAISAPADGATVNGSTTIDANASDNVAVTGVQFKLDGANLGAEDTTAPYSLAWDTTTATNGTHTLTAVARDAAGNTTTSAPIGVEVANSAPPAPPPSGLVAAYGFDELGGIVAGDASGLGNAGTVSGAQWSASGHTAGALSFDGVDDWVTVADASSLDLTTGMTIEAWVNPSAGGGWRSLVMKERAGGFTYALYSSSTSGGRARGYAGGSASATAATALPLGTWSHLAFTFDGSVLRMYLNGVAAGSSPSTTPMPTSTGPLRIGGTAVWPEFFAGLVDDVRVYNRALSPSEIQTDIGTPVR